MPIDPIAQITAEMNEYLRVTSVSAPPAVADTARMALNYAYGILDAGADTQLSPTQFANYCARLASNGFRPNFASIWKMLDRSIRNHATGDAAIHIDSRFG